MNKICTNPNCSSKGISKPITDFFKQSGSKDGFASRCKLCITSAVKQYAKTSEGKQVAKKSQYKFNHSEHGRKYKRDWMRNAYHNRLGYKEKMIERQKQHNAELRKTIPARYRITLFPSTQKVREMAYDAVKYAIRIGKLKSLNLSQCSICNKQAKYYHHNKGYEKHHQLSVIPVCQKCHDKIHGL